MLLEKAREPSMHAQPRSSVQLISLVDAHLGGSQINECIWGTEKGYRKDLEYFYLEGYKKHEINRKCNLNMQPNYETNANKPKMQPKYATNATNQCKQTQICNQCRAGGRAEPMLGGGRAEPTPAGGRSGRRVWERVKFSRMPCLPLPMTRR